MIREQGPNGFYVCSNCYITLSSKRSLEQAQNRKKKLNSGNETKRSEPIGTAESENKENYQPSSPKRLRSSIGGPLHTKDSCVWCLKGADLRHPDRKNGKSMRIPTASGWREFKRHTVFVEDETMRLRLSRLVESTTALTDAFAADIMYHRSCWLENISNNGFDNDEAIHLQNVTYSEMKHLFLRRVDNIIFSDHEIRSLQSLLQEYKQVANEYGFFVGKLKSSFVKETLIKEYGNDIGFKERNAKNKSEVVYDTKGGGDYIEAALNSFGVTDEQLIENLAPRLSTKVKEIRTVNWPPRIDQLEEEEDVCKLLLKLLSCMKKKGVSNESSLEEDPVLRTFASLITYYVTGKRTATAVNLAVLIHGMTRSRELIDILHKCGLCISYNDVLLLYDTWALTDAECSRVCPAGIANSIPVIIVFDNDDFKTDTMSGDAKTAHRTNVMFVQPESYEENDAHQPELSLRKKEFVTSKLKQVSSDLTAVQQYRCPHGSTTEPPMRAKIEPPTNGTAPQRARSVIHALTRADNDCARPPPHEQMVPAYSGMQSCLVRSTKKSKAYYHTTYNEPPKKSVVYDVMIKANVLMNEKDIPFSFLVGDMPSYKLIVELKAENPNLFKDIVPVIGAFHQQMSYIYAIYKRFQGSEISDTLVAAGIIVEGSVDQALRGKHYRRGVWCILLWREALIQKRLSRVIQAKPLTEDIKNKLDVLRNALSITRKHLKMVHNDLQDDDEITDITKKQDLIWLTIGFLFSKCQTSCYRTFTSYGCGPWNNRTIEQNIFFKFKKIQN